MFPDNQNQNSYQDYGGGGSSHPNWVFIVIYLVLFFSIVGGGFFAVQKIRNKNVKQPGDINPQTEERKETSSSTNSALPDDLGTNTNHDAIDLASTSVQAENLAFGHFYKQIDDNFKPSQKSYTLPINIKVDVANYHDIARKINLDPYIDNLNKNGFAVLDNQFSAEANNFFDLYRFILRKDVPVVITSDFLIYYYQNNLKQVYKDIEQNAFYETLWNINKSFYDMALVRYKQKREAASPGNDPVLEGARMELAYFATALKLLMPQGEQVSHEANLNDATKFNEQEAENFYFTMPSYLTDDVDREVNLIRTAKENTKSPVMLFQKDYTSFMVPADYKHSAKLNNFYLATRWMNSLFPLYYRNEACPDCLLDYNDWNVNLIAASFITKDFSENQLIKNQWATIYKFISFFSGLRHELTYLHYQNVLSELFGADYEIENVFSFQNENREVNIKKIQESLSKYSFAGIEGGLSRDNPDDRKKLGMRILQQPYWPNDYIFEKLTGDDMSFLGTDIEINTMSSKNSRIKYRDRGFAMDILNITEGVKYKSPYFIENTNYARYDEKIDALRWEFGNFTGFTWNDNVYWSTLDIAKNLFNYNDNDMPVFMRNEAWKGGRSYDLFLSAWTNLHLSGDMLGNYNENQDAGLGDFGDVCNNKNYVEPNIKLMRELIARNNMLSGMLSSLSVTKKTNVAELRLRDVNKKFEGLVDISKKELSDTPLNYDDCKFLNNFVKLHIIEKYGDKVMMQSTNLLQERLDGVKILSVVYEKDGEKTIVFGPIFKYTERMSNIK